MTLQKLEQALRSLAVKRDLKLGRMNSGDLLLLLALASRCIATAGRFSESAVNEALKAWLGGTGGMLRIDHVELRRTLIDYGLWQRDNYGKQYWKGNGMANPELDRLLRALDQLAPERLVAQHRAEYFAERERRKSIALGETGKSSVV